MNSKINRVILFLSVCLLTFCVAALAAVIIVESSGPQRPVPDTENSKLGGSSFHYEKNDGEDEKTDVSKRETPQGEQNAPNEANNEKDETYDVDVNSGAVIIYEKSGTQEDNGAKNKVRPALSEVIDSIPFKEKVKIIKKYLPKLTSQDVKLFSELLSGKSKDYKEAKKRFYEIYTSEEIEDMYKIYKKYEDKFYESQGD